MRIVKNGDVHISAPMGMPKKEIEAFISKNQEWIAKARKKSAERLKQQTDFYDQLPLSTRAQKADAAKRAESLIIPMLERYSKIIVVSPSSVSFKPMTSRWGVCNVKSRSIRFSTYLLLLPEWCVENVVVHELCHLLEPSHNARFHALMDKYYPKWKEARRLTREIAKGENKN